jgi:hypothetical protein
MICCNGDCDQGRNCPMRARLAEADKERIRAQIRAEVAQIDATQAAKVAKAHRQLAAIVAKEKAAPATPPVEPVPATPAHGLQALWFWRDAVALVLLFLIGASAVSTAGYFLLLGWLA